MLSNVVSATDNGVGNQTMSDIVGKYVKRKAFTDKVPKVNNLMINSLNEVVRHFGDNVFNRNKSVFSQQIIENTIPTMVAHGIVSIKDNLIELPSVRKNSLEHYRLIYGDTAEQIYQEKVEKGLQTENNFIKRHGFTKGTKLWQKYSKNKSKQNTLEGYQERFGKIKGKQKFEEYSKRQRYTNSLEYYIEIYGEDRGYTLYNKRYPSDYDLDKYTDYKKTVYKLSNTTYVNNIERINPNNYPRTRMGVENGWQLDHIKPVNECFRDGVPPEEAASITNLRMLPWRENLMRNYE